MAGPASKLRGFLLLARASNLPTVWSNCLAGWLLCGGRDWPLWGLILVCFGASCLYIGGMFLNDAFDARFDQQFRPERPIPSGLISLRTVWIFGSVFLLVGMGVLAWFGPITAIFAFLLVAMILAYDAVHKKTILSPVLMGACRFLLYLVAASVATYVAGIAVWSALVLALYIVGLSYIAKAESAPGPLRYWPLPLLASPIVLAWIVNDFGYRSPGVILSCVLGGWIAWSLRHIFWTKTKNIGASVSGLLAGIVLVDLLAVGPSDLTTLVTFVVWFLAARVFQKVIPAT